MFLDETTKIFSYNKPIDMRLGYNSLISIVMSEFENIDRCMYFLFFNEKKNTVKIMKYDGFSMEIWSKKLIFGVFESLQEGNITKEELSYIISSATSVKIRKAI